MARLRIYTKIKGRSYLIIDFVLKIVTQRGNRRLRCLATGMIFFPEVWRMRKSKSFDVMANRETTWR